MTHWKKKHAFTALAALLCVAAWIAIGKRGKIGADATGVETPQVEARFQYFKRLARAIAAYEERNGELPALGYYLSDGVKKSWRTVLSEHIVNEGHSAAYNNHEPWNSEENLEYQRYAMGFLFICPGSTTPEHQTDIAMIVRDELPGTRKQVKDRWWIVESWGIGIDAAEPRDLPSQSLLGSEGSFGPGRAWAGGDGYVFVITDDLRVIKLRTN